MAVDVIKLFAENKMLKAQLNNSIMINKNQARTITMYEEKLETMVNDAVNKAISQVKVEYEKIINELNQKVAKLECKLNTNSSNSSIPISKNPIAVKISNQRTISNKNIGAQKGHKQNKLDYFEEEEITETKEHVQTVCPNCKCLDLEFKSIVISDIIDFNIEVTKTRNKIYQYNCTRCKRGVTSNDILPRGASYGSNVNASAIILMNDANVPINKVRKYFTGLSNEEINMSEGYISKLQVKVASKLDDFIDELKTKILREKIVHWDDTEIKIAISKGYLRFYGNEKLALIIAHANKKEEGFETDGIFENLTEEQTLVHDHVLYTYNEKFKFQNSECNSHILRYLQAITDNVHNHNWEKELSKLLKEANDNRAGKTHYEESYIKDIYNRYDEILKLGYVENNNLPDYHFYKEKELLLISRLDKYRDAHLLFIKDFDVPFTNNTAERSFRISKSKIKISGLFQNIITASNYAKILTYMETCYRNRINKHLAIKRLLDGNPYTIKELIAN